MRHSYATRLLESQVNIGFAAEQMGHSMEIFLRTYAKWLGGDRNKLEMEKVEKVDAMIRSALANAAIASVVGRE
jgi:integrase